MLNEKAIKSRRNPSVELLRCLLMFLIVLHHVAYWGLGLDYTGSYLIPFLFTTLIYWHVDGFITISGWFGVRFSLVRILQLFGVIFFYSMINSVYMYCHEGLSPWKAIRVWGGWYGSSYLAFMFIAPLLNEAVAALKTRRRTLFLVWACFMCGMLLNWAPFNFFTGVSASGGGSMSILTFITVYVNVRFVRVAEIDVYFTRKKYFTHLYCFCWELFCSQSLGLRGR